MADELPSAPTEAEGGSRVASPATSAGPASQMGEAGPVDTRLADILKRKAAGETLSHSDRGYLGTVKRRAAKQADLVTPAPADKNPLLETATNPDNPLFASPPPGEAVAPLPAAPAYNTETIHRTAQSILDLCDTVTQDLIGDEFKKAGADARTVDVWKDAVAMKTAKPIMVEGSDPIIIWLCEKLDCAPEQLETKVKGSGFLAGMGLWIYGIHSAVKAAKEFQAEKLKRDRPA